MVMCNVTEEPIVSMNVVYASTIHDPACCGC